MELQQLHVSAADLFESVAVIYTNQSVVARLIDDSNVSERKTAVRVSNDTSRRTQLLHLRGGSRYFRMLLGLEVNWTELFLFLVEMRRKPRK